MAQADEDYVLTEKDFPAPVQWDSAGLKDEEDYGRTAFELLREAGITVTLLVHSTPPTSFPRNEAIRRALIKRISLLGKSLLADIDANSGYQHGQLSRQIIEAASIYFHLTDDETGERHDAYVLQSLAEEKANLEIIAEEIKKRGGDPLPIEERMRRSIERMASAAGIDFDAVPGKRKIDWPKSIERLEALSPVAYVPYRTGSSAVHAGWSVLLLQDLEEVEGGFTLDKQIRPKVQPITAAAIVMVETALHYLDREGSEAEKCWFRDRLADLSLRIRALDEAHEEFMQTG